MSARALPPDPLLVGANRSSDILKVVPTEFVAKCVGEHERHHRLADYARGWDGAGVGSLTQRLSRLVRGDVDGAKRLGEGGQRLHRAADDERLARGHPTFQSPGAVRFTVVAVRGLVEDLVVGL